MTGVTHTLLILTELRCHYAVNYQKHRYWARWRLEKQDYKMNLFIYAILHKPSEETLYSHTVWFEEFGNDLTQKD